MLKLFMYIVIGIILGDAVSGMADRIEKKANQDIKDITNDKESE